MLQKFQDIEENHILHMKEIIRSYSQSVEETHVQIGEVSVSVHTHFNGYTHTLTHTFLWLEACLVDLWLCSLSSRCVRSIIVFFDLFNRFTEKQEVLHSDFYSKQLKADQNSLSDHLKHLHQSKHFLSLWPDVCCWSHFLLTEALRFEISWVLQTGIRDSLTRVWFSYQRW